MGQANDHPLQLIAKTSGCKSNYMNCQDFMEFMNK